MLPLPGDPAPYRFDLTVQIVVVTPHGEFQFGRVNGDRLGRFVAHSDGKPRLALVWIDGVGPTGVTLVLQKRLEQVD